MSSDALVGVVVGLALAAACGLRVFLPLLVMGLAARCGLFVPASGFAWLGATPALIALGVATVVEIAAYHVPWLDHLLDHAGAPLAVAAGVVAMAASTHEFSPFLRWALAVVAGGGMAGAFQGLTGLARIGSTLTTGGLANPFFASLEALGALVISLAALALPLLALLLVVILGGFALRRRRRPA